MVFNPLLSETLAELKRELGYKLRVLNGDSLMKVDAVFDPYPGDLWMNPDGVPRLLVIGSSSLNVFVIKNPDLNARPEGLARKVEKVDLRRYERMVWENKDPRELVLSGELDRIRFLPAIQLLDLLDGDELALAEKVAGIVEEARKGKIPDDYDMEEVKELGSFSPREKKKGYRMRVFYYDDLEELVDLDCLLCPRRGDSWVDYSDYSIVFTVLDYNPENRRILLFDWRDVDTRPTLARRRSKLELLRDLTSHVRSVTMREFHRIIVGLSEGITLYAMAFYAHLGVYPGSRLGRRDGPDFDEVRRLLRILPTREKLVEHMEVCP